MNNKNLEERFSQLRFLNKGLISLKETAANLGISTRQVQRLAKRLKTNHWNPKALLPRSRGSWNRMENLREKVISLHQQRPERSNPAIQELLSKEGIEVSPATIRRIRIKAGLYKEAKIEKRYFKKFEAKRFGDLLQMDTLQGYWLGGKPTKLILVVDDYSRAILAAQWTNSDNTWQNMVVLREIIEKYGLPAVIYTDNDSKFRTIRHKRSRFFNYREEDYETQIKRALRELNIALVCHPPYQAFCKGKIERLFRFIQERFLPEIQAKNFEELNQEFSKWVKWYNSAHPNRMTGCKPKERFQPLGFKPLSGKTDLDYVFSLRITRKIDKYNSFSFNGKQYFLNCKEPFWGEKVTLALNPNHKIKAYYNNEFLQEFKLN